MNEAEEPKEQMKNQQVEKHLEKHLVEQKTIPPIIGIHTLVYTDEGAQMTIDSLAGLADQGVNLLVVEVGYSYQFESHKELAEKYGLSFHYARRLSNRAKELGILVVPEMACLGHQSWEENTSTLLTVYPELDETVGLYSDN